jgi:hypothetical protein
MSEHANASYCVGDPRAPMTEGDVVEIPLLLSGCQASILETAAHQRGLTAAVMVRHLVRDFLLSSPVHSGQPS